MSQGNNQEQDLYKRNEKILKRYEEYLEKRKRIALGTEKII